MSSNSEADELTRTIIQTIAEKKPQNVRQLVALVKERLPVAEERILDVVLKLQSQGKISLESPLPWVSPKLAAYVKTSQALWYWVTVAVAAFTVALVFAVPEDFYPWSYLRNAVGIVFVLWLPGYGVIKALFPVRVPIEMSIESLDAVERVVLSVGMSLAIVPLVGLVLNYTPWGVRLVPIVLSLFALTVVSATVAVGREHRAKACRV